MQCSQDSLDNSRQLLDQRELSCLRLWCMRQCDTKVCKLCTGSSTHWARMVVYRRRILDKTVFPSQSSCIHCVVLSLLETLISPVFLGIGWDVIASDLGENSTALAVFRSKVRLQKQLQIDRNLDCRTASVRQQISGWFEDAGWIALLQ